MKTAWFSGNQKPARVGMYRRKYRFKTLWCLYDGYQWRVGYLDYDFAEREFRPSANQYLPWEAIIK